MRNLNLKLSLLYLLSCGNDEMIIIDFVGKIHFFSMSQRLKLHYAISIRAAYDLFVHRYIPHHLHYPLVPSFAFVSATMWENYVKNHTHPLSHRHAKHNGGCQRFFRYGNHKRYTLFVWVAWNIWMLKRESSTCKSMQEGVLINKQ